MYYNMIADYDLLPTNEIAALLRRFSRFLQPVAAQVLGRTGDVQPVAGQSIPSALFLAK